MEKPLSSGRHERFGVLAGNASIGHSQYAPKALMHGKHRLYPNSASSRSVRSVLGPTLNPVFGASGGQPADNAHGIAEAQPVPTAKPTANAASERAPATTAGRRR